VGSERYTQIEWLALLGLLISQLAFHGLCYPMNIIAGKRKPFNLNVTFQWLAIRIRIQEVMGHNFVMVYG
jgi:hypothetical protein